MKMNWYVFEPEDGFSEQQGIFGTYAAAKRHAQNCCDTNNSPVRLSKGFYEIRGYSNRPWFIATKEGARIQGFL